MDWSIVGLTWLGRELEVTLQGLLLDHWMTKGWGWVGPCTGGDCRPVRPSLRCTGPQSWLSGSKAERPGTAPILHTVALVCGRRFHGACVWRRMGGGG